MSSIAKHANVLIAFADDLDELYAEFGRISLADLHSGHLGKVLACATRLDEMRVQLRMIVTNGTPLATR